MLKHVVMFKFKKDAPESAIAEIETGIAQLPGLIPEILEFESGSDVIHSEGSYDFGLVSGFESLETMKQYQVHPAHQKVLVKIKEYCESVLVVDFYK